MTCYICITSKRRCWVPVRANLPQVQRRLEVLQDQQTIRIGPIMQDVLQRIFPRSFGRLWEEEVVRGYFDKLLAAVVDSADKRLSVSTANAIRAMQTITA